MNNDAFVDYYALLKIQSDASAEDIERAYRFEIRYWHPDNYASRPKDYQEQAARTPVLLNQAREILFDEQKRPLYDELYEEWKASHANQGTYSARITRETPGCFMFLIDQSGSMSDPFGAGGDGESKGEILARIMNKLLSQIVTSSSKDEGIRHYFDIGVIGYGSRVGPALGGSLSGQMLIPIKEIADNPTRLEQRQRSIPDGSGGQITVTERLQVWLDPTASGETHMCEAFRLAFGPIEEWTKLHPNSFPPIVFNITDGEVTDGDPTDDALRLHRLSTTDGNLLLFNLHLSSRATAPIVYPDSEERLPDEFAVLLYRLASRLPPYLQDRAREEGYRVSESTRGFLFNGVPDSVTSFLRMGTDPVNMR